MMAEAMLYTVVVSAPVAMSAWLVARFLRAHGREERIVWVVALAATLLVPPFVLLRPRPAPEPVATTLESVLVEDASSITTAPQALPALPAPAAARLPDLDLVLLAIWIGLSFAIAARWILCAIRLGSLRSTWIPEKIDGVPVTLTSELGPAVAGLLRPAILVPAWVPALPRHQRALVLAHEQEHIRARDPWLGTLVRMGRLLCPWNPATWMLGVALRRAMELDCDRRVLRRHPDVESYGVTLLAVSARGSNRLAAVAAFAETDVPLRKRILAMTTPARRMSVPGAVAVLVMGIGLLSCTAAVPVPVLRAAALSVPEPTAQRSSATRNPIPQQALPEPRVVASKEERWQVMHRSVADFAAGNPPLMRFPYSQRDSVWAVVYEMLGDSSLYALRDSVIDGLLPIEAATRLPVATNSPALPSDAPPPMTVSPHILNPDEIVRAIAAAYPSDLLARGRGGTVGMQFHVGPAGEVLDYQIGQISAYPALDRAAMEVAAVYRFSPGVAGDEPVSVWVAHAISFYPPE